MNSLFDHDRHILPCARATIGTACISDGNARPVWPIADDSTQDLLRKLSQFWGAALVETPIVNRTPKVVTTQRAVLSVSENGHGPGRLYAHLTKRSHKICNAAEFTLRSDSLLQDVDVIVAPSELVDAPVLQWLAYSPKCGQNTIGLILGLTEEQLLQAVLVRSAARHLSLQNKLGPAPEPVICLPTTRNVPQNLSMHGFEDMIVISGDNPPHDVREALQAEHGCLTICTHSDGVDAYLGEHLTLCSQHTWGSELPSTGVPRCVETGLCHRATATVQAYQAGAAVPPDAPTISEASTTDALFHAQDLRARTLIWGGCWGIFDNNGAMAPSYALLNGWIASPSIGSIAVSWKQTHSPPLSWLTITSDLQNGTSIGDAVSRHNQRAIEEQSHCRLCLLGDPDLRVVPTRSVRANFQGENCSPSTPTKPRSNSTYNVQTPADDRTVLAALCNIAAFSPRSTASRIRAGLRGIHHWMHFESTPTNISDAQNAVLRLIAVLGPSLAAEWSHLAQSKEIVKKKVSCPHCGCQTDGYRFKFATSGFSQRIIRFCPRCAQTHDVPEGYSNEISHEHTGEVTFLEPIQDDNTTALVLLNAQVPAESQILEWPKQSNGLLKRSIKLPDSLPSGPFELVTYIAMGKTFAMFNRRMPSRGSAVTQTAKTIILKR